MQGHKTEKQTLTIVFPSLREKVEVPLHTVLAQGRTGE